MAVYSRIREVSLIITSSVAFLPNQTIQEIRQRGVNKDLDTP